MLTTALRISRPRFWVYLFGPYMVGFAFGSNHIDSLWSTRNMVGMLTFLLPANVFLYGINDYFDYETDRTNPRKKNEEVMMPQRLTRVYRIVLVLSLVAMAPFGVISTSIGRMLFGIFLLLSFSYSAPPFRLKSRPWLDWMSNILYVFPGLIGYTEQTGMLPSGELVLGFFCWTGAMHVFSAIQDIRSDARAGILTTAVFLGKKKSLVLCLILWSIFSIVVSQYGFMYWASWIYPILALGSLATILQVQALYRYFPLINGMVGFVAFLFILSQRL